MLVPLIFQLGMSGPDKPASTPLRLDSRIIGTASGWAGSYHVLEMGRHYDEYTVGGLMPSLPVIPGLRIAHPYCRLTNRLRDPGITGNIGECVAAIFASQMLGIPQRDIAHLRPRKAYHGTQSPDYVMRIGPAIKRVLRAHFPKRAAVAVPDKLPVESKARYSKAQAKQARHAAYKQLAAYWTHVPPLRQEFGLIVSLTYGTPQEIRVNICLPGVP